MRAADWFLLLLLLITGFLCCKLLCQSVWASFCFTQYSSRAETTCLGRHKGTSDVTVLVFHRGLQRKRKNRRLDLIGRNSNLGPLDGCRMPPEPLARTMASVQHLYSLHSVTDPSLTKKKKKCMLAGCFRSGRMWRGGA